MKIDQYTQGSSIYALATAYSPSALAIIRISGDNCIKDFAPCFSNPEKLLKAKGYSILYGYIINPKTKKRLDQILLSVFKAPKSFTGEDSLELNIHGSLNAINMISLLLEEAGFDKAKPGEFSFRAMLNNKMDLTQAQAITEIVQAKSQIGYTLAFNRLEGGLKNYLLEIKEDVLTLLAGISLSLDYAEDEIEEDYDLKTYEDLGENILKKVDLLLETYSPTKLYSDGATISLVGPVNAGKSSLFNLLLNQDRSIVSDIAGTTRDYVEANTQIKGIPIHLIDTAGLNNNTNDKIEIQGIKRTKEIISDSDIILLVYTDFNEIKDDPYFKEISLDKRVLKVKNKIDILNKDEDVINLSTKNREGYKELLDKIEDFLKIDSSLDSKYDITIGNERQLILLKQLKENQKLILRELELKMHLDLVATLAAESHSIINSLLGKIDDLDVLGEIFSRFCVGK